jgi:signal transduction histidine kinase
MDGMALLRRIKNDPTLAQTPVVLETAHGDMESIRDGLTQGAYYYLTKPFQADVLIGVIKAALQQSRDLRTLVDGVQPADRPLGLLHTGSFRFRNLEEGNLLAYYLARVCPDPERTIQGMLELLVNAVEHGNLEISYAEKGALILEGCWRDEVQRRLNDPAYRNRYVEIHFRRQDDLLSFTIQDQGQGFDWNQYLEFSPERAFDLNGRGIAMAGKLSFDHLEYRGNGNTVVATVRLPDTATCPTA